MYNNLQRGWGRAIMTQRKRRRLTWRRRLAARLAFDRHHLTPFLLPEYDESVIVAFGAVFGAPRATVAYVYATESDAIADNAIAMCGRDRLTEDQASIARSNAARLAARHTR